MATQTDPLWDCQGVEVLITYNTSKPDNVTQAVCINHNAVDITLRLFWLSKGPTDFTVPAGGQVQQNPSPPQQADLIGFGVIVPQGV